MYHVFGKKSSKVYEIFDSLNKTLELHQKIVWKINMKVVIISTYWKNSPGGGVKNYLINLVNALDSNKKVKVSVIYMEGYDGNNPYSYKIKGGRLLFSIRSLLILRKINPQCIHSQGSWYCLLPAFLYKKTNNVRIIHTFHTTPTKKLSLFGRWFFQFLLNGCDCCTFVSKDLEIKIKEFYRLKFNKVKITYAGVNSKNVSQEEIQDFCTRFGIKGNHTILLGLGLTALPYKAEGAKLLLKTMKKLKEKYPNLILVLTRKGQFSNELKKIALEEGVQDNVIFTDDIENAYVPIAICDIYTHITLDEGGLSLSILEAMSMGKPIIATNVGGIPEIINSENGILISPNESQIIEKIEYLLNNKDYASKLGKNAKKTVENRHTWKKVVNNFLSIYQLTE